MTDVSGAYFILFPRARVITLIPFFILPWFVEIPAVFYLGADRWLRPLAAFRL